MDGSHLTTNKHRTCLNTKGIQSDRIEWPTVFLLVAVYGGWLGITLLIAEGYGLLYLALIPILTLHSSLQHEIMHGHPTPWHRLNTVLASLPIGFVIPYLRFKDLHLKHHRNWLLTDPFDDTESYFLAKSQWKSLSRLERTLLQINNTLLGRLLIGPPLMLLRFYYSELSLIRSKAKDVSRHWLQHACYLMPVIAWLYWLDISAIAYAIIGIWPAVSLLLLRAYSEHLPIEDVQQRSAIIPSCRLMSLLFLNNNFHRVHHDKPRLAWYRIPDHFYQHYQTVNQNSQGLPYQPFVNGYWQLFKHYAFRAKFPVVHPFLYTEDPSAQEKQTSS